MWRHIHCHTCKKSESVGNGFTWLMMIENNNMNLYQNHCPTIPNPRTSNPRPIFTIFTRPVTKWSHNVCIQLDSLPYVDATGAALLLMPQAVKTLVGHHSLPQWPALQILWKSNNLVENQTWQSVYQQNHQNHDIETNGGGPRLERNGFIACPQKQTSISVSHDLLYWCSHVWPCLPSIPNESTLAQKNGCGMLSIFNFGVQ